jgi:hypothetical protein
MRLRLTALQPRPDCGENELPTLLSRALLAFTIDYERESEWSLTLTANQLRVLSADGMPLRELSRRSGVSPEVTASQGKFMVARGLAGIDGQSKRIALTARGIGARREYVDRLRIVEDQWRQQFGESAIAALKSTSERILDQRLSPGLRPYPDGWRSRGPYAARTAAMLDNPREFLPHHPVISHRGGYPDGS